ncbi:hypothetical protein [Mycolicibacterium llatzerense]|uniref:hypothetical protein n=1 Tax=Mycolicibacterium llatzerense TaxID=280871 RepID=UPI00068E289A|nr:hypothetical protein [Mycolicibacterium llatzerense]MCT7369825.1 hypothetical protein [Mycolicibacterium llatzerense]
MEADDDTTDDAAAAATQPASATGRRLGLRVAVAGAVMLGLVIAASLGMYLLHRNSNYTENFGASDNPDRNLRSTGPSRTTRSTGTRPR